GVRPDLIVLDPGLGFGKRPEHNWPLLAGLADVSVLGGRRFPVLVGASRKGFIGKLLASPDGAPRPFAESDDATVATTALAAAAGAWCVRVHKVPPNVDAVRVAAAWRAGAHAARAADSADSADSTAGVAAGVGAVLAIGANLGDRLGTLRAAVTALGRVPGITVLAVSPVYETDPVGGPDQPAYFNAVLTVRTTLGPRELLRAANGVEAAFGRVREVRFGPRTLDIDIIGYGDQTSDDPVLTLPHPRARERAFVLVPWLDVDPGAVLPDGRVADLLAGLDASGVRRRAESLRPEDS